MAVEKQVNVIISAVDQFSGALTGLDGHFDKIALAAVAIEAAILAASIAAAKFAVDIGQDCFDSAVDFHDAIYDVEAVASSFGTTGEEIGNILDDLVNKFPVTGEVGGEALQLIAQMGYGAKDELDKVSDSAMTLSIATGTDLRVAAEATMASMNQFGFEIDEVDRVINLFAATSFTSAATVTDLKEAMKYAGAEAALSGISIEETAAACGILKDKGLEASQAGTTFRMALSQLYKESEKGEESLKKYGLTYDDVNPSIVGLTGVVEAFDRQTLSAEDAMNIFGVRSKSFALLINDGAESFKNYVKEISNTEAAYAAAEIKLGKWSVVMDNVEGSMDIFKKTIAADLVPSLIELVGKTENDGIRGVITQLMELEKESGKIGGPMVDLFESLQDVAKDLFKDAFGDVEGFYNWLSLISEALGKNIEVLAIWGAAAIEAFVGATDDSEKLTFVLELVNGAITALMVPVGIIHDLFVGFFYALELGWDSAEYTVYKFAETVATVVLAITVALDALPFVDLGNRIEHMKGQVEKWGEAADSAFNTEAPDLWTGKIVEASAKATVAIERFGAEGKKSQEEMEKAVALTADEILKLGDNYEVVNGKVTKNKESTDELKKSTEGVSDEIPEWAAGAEYAGIWIDKAKDVTEELTTASQETTKAVKETKDSLSEIEKFELSLEKAKFESDLKIAEQAASNIAELIETKLEWSAKINIAEIEAAADVAIAEAATMQTAFDAVSNSIAGISGGLGAITQALTSGELSMGEKWRMEDLLEEQVAMQRDLVDSQVEMNEAIIKTQEAKAEALEKGEGEIGVEIIGNTEGWLKGLMESLFEEIMMKAKTESFSVFGTE